LFSCGLTNYHILSLHNKIMIRFERYSDLSRDDGVSSIVFTKNKTSTKGLVALGVVLFAITTIVGWYMISGPEQFSISYMMGNFILWGTSLVLILFGYNNRNT